jgi:hypothetical protein
MTILNTIIPDELVEHAFHVVGSPIVLGGQRFDATRTYLYGERATFMVTNRYPGHEANILAWLRFPKPLPTRDGWPTDDRAWELGC